MKKKIVMMALAAMMCIGMNAQERRNRTVEEMQARRTARTERKAQQLAEDMDLKGEAKEQFIAAYKDMVKEIEAANVFRRQQANAAEKEKKDDKKAKMTPEEANKMMQQQFVRRQQEIEQMQKVLQIQQEYYKRMQQFLDGSQLMRVFDQRNNTPRQAQMNRMRQGAPRQGMQRGGDWGGQRNRQWDNDFDRD